MASGGRFDLGFVAVKRLVIMMALFRFSRSFRMLLLISLETFLVSHSSVLKTTSFVSLEVSLISSQSYFLCFLSPCLPRGRFPCLVCLSSSSSVFLSLF